MKQLNVINTFFIKKGDSYGRMPAYKLEDNTFMLPEWDSTYNPPIIIYTNYLDLPKEYLNNKK